MKLASERLNTSHGVCKILIAGWPPPVPDLLKSHRQSGKRFPGFPARKRELRGARNRAHVLTRRARAILPHHPAVFQVRDARPVRRMNGLAEISTHGGFPGNPDPLLPGANEGDGIGGRQFSQNRASRPVAEEHYSQPHNHGEDDRPKQYLGSHRIAAYLAEKSQEQIRNPPVDTLSEQIPPGRAMHAAEFPPANDALKCRARAWGAVRLRTSVGVRLVREVEGPIRRFRGLGSPRLWFFFTFSIKKKCSERFRGNGVAPFCTAYFPTRSQVPPPPPPSPTC